MRYDQEREQQFRQAVTEYIGPILATLGLNRTEASAYGMTFESSKVTLSITYEGHSCEIDVTLARRTCPAERYTLRDLLYAQSVNGEEGLFQASDPQRVIFCIKQISALLMQYGQNALTGEATIYQRMGASRSSRAERYTKEVVQEPVRRAAEEAWHRHDYGRVRSLYSSIEEDLTKVERGRLRYTQKIAAQDKRA